MKTIQLNGKTYGIVGIPSNASEISYRVFVDEKISRIEFKSSGSIYSAQINTVVKDAITKITDEIKTLVRDSGTKFRNEIKVPANYDPNFNAPVTAALNKKVELEVAIAASSIPEEEEKLKEQLTVITGKLEEFNQQNKELVDYENDLSSSVENVILVEV